MFSNSSILIFTDLDGTLLNRDTFKFDSIKPFLKELKNKNIIIIPNSSKTEDEIIEFNNEADFQFPFVSENGSIIHNLNFLNHEFPDKIMLARNTHEIQNIFDKNIILAGKTGTTQINYATDRVEYVSSFVGYFPANNPKYSCIVVISKPNKAVGYYGNKVAAPVFKKIAKSVINNIPNELKLNIDDINRLSDLVNQPSDNTKVLDKS